VKLIASIFRVGKSASEDKPFYSLSDLFYPEDGGETFFRKVGSYKTHAVPS
jgi:hypothetical protein